MRRPTMIALFLCSLAGLYGTAAAQTRKPDTDSETPVQTRAMRFAGETPPFRVFVQYPWLVGEGSALPVRQINAATSHTVLDWVQQFSMSYARVEADANWQTRRAPARLEVVYRIARPTQRLLNVIYSRQWNDGRMENDLQTVQTDTFDMQSFRPLAMRDLLEGDRWVKAAAERVESSLKQEAAKRGGTLFPSFSARDWLGDIARWQFEKGAATLHFRPGEVAAEALGRFDVALPYAVFSVSARRNGPLAALLPKEEPGEERADRPPRQRQ